MRREWKIYWDDENEVMGVCSPNSSGQSLIHVVELKPDERVIDVETIKQLIPILEEVNSINSSQAELLAELKSLIPEKT